MFYLQNPEKAVTVIRRIFLSETVFMNEIHSANRILTGAILLAGLISLLHILFCFDLYDDIAAWYAPMVRAFAAGDWNDAFTPAVPVLSTTMAGLLSCFGVEPFRALVVISCLFYLASIPVLYYVLKYFLKREDYAAWGCVLYVLAPKIIRFSCTGLLNPAKNFFLIAAVALILASAKRLSWRNSVFLGIVMVGLALTRAEAVIFLPFLVLWYAYFIFRDRGVELKKRLFRILLHGLAMTAIFFVGVLPRLYQSYQAVGVPVLDVRQAPYLTMVLPLAETVCRPGFRIAAEYQTEVPSPKWKSGGARIWQGVECWTRGAYTPYLLLAILGLWRWWKKRQDQAEVWLLFSIIAINTAVLITVSNSVRYYTITLIMLLPFTFMGIKFLWDLLPDKKPLKFAAAAVLAAAAALQILNGGRKAISHKYDYEYQTGLWLKTHRAMLRPSGARLVVAAIQPQYPFWADAVWLRVADNQLQFTEQLPQLEKADFVVLGHKHRELVEILSRRPVFKLLTQEKPEALIFVNTGRLGR
ncbi:MAG: hypothetical protein PHH77_05570 [Victivallaceae bacterium]|nr:hypothetical protein [Victivallaceae bacterium]